MRATIVVATDEANEASAVEAWFSKWGSQLSHQSGDQGCGCCVRIWDVEGPDAAIRELPEAVRAQSDWTRMAAS